LRIMQNEKTLQEQSQTGKVKALGQQRLEYSINRPQEIGAYQIIAEINGQNEQLVQSIRDFKMIAPQEGELKNNLAYLKKASTSSTLEDFRVHSYGPEKAVDGLFNTRWSSEFKDQQWLAVDLGEMYEISGVEIIWEQAYAKSYTLQVSEDGQKWINAYHTDSGKGDREPITIKPITGQWVRMMGHKRATEWGFSIYEFRVSGKKVAIGGNTMEAFEQP